jgi:hypothetical protein
MPKTENIACRLSISELKEIDSAASDLELTRSEWLMIAIARQLGKRPRLPLATRVNALEKQIAALSEAMGIEP